MTGHRPSAPRSFGAILFFSLLLGFLPSAGSGQVVRGRLVDAAADRPLEGAMVALLDAGERVVTNTLTDALGRFTLQAPASGEYSLRADRIGFASAYSDPIRLARGDTVTHRMETRFEPVALEGIAVESEKRCQIRPEEGLATARVWEEARKALAAASWTQEKKGYRYRILGIDRRLGPEGRRVRSEERRRTAGFARNPITSRPAPELVEEGFARQMEDGDWMYFAPDARVLLSDPFLDTHCMGVERGEGERAGLLGLRFRPLEGQRTPDIAGTLWLEPTTAELQRLDFRYVNLEPRLDGVTLNDRVGGEIRFQDLPNGAWIVQEWRIRMPLVARQGRPGEYGTTATLGGLHEIGGLVTRVQRDDDRTVFSAATGTVVGTVVDSLGRAPVEGARVRVVGTADTTTTDWSGIFTFSGLSDGVYDVAFTHPRLDSLAYRPEPTSVTVETGEARSVRLTAPSTRDVLASHCRSQEGFDPGDGATLLGRFVHQETGEPVSDAILEILWQQDEIQGKVHLQDVPSEYGRRESSRRRLGWHAGQRDPGAGASPAQYWRVRHTDYGLRVWPDRNGYYVVCRVQTKLPLELVARRGSAVSDTTRLELPLETEVRSFTVRAPEVGSATLAGIVEEWQSGAPLEEARVELVGSRFVERTDGEGRFRMVRVLEGTYPLRVVASAYDAVVDTVRLEADDARQLRIQVPLEPIAVEGITVEALSRREVERRARGRAEDYAGSDEMATIAEKARTMAGVLREMGSPRIKVREFGGSVGAGFCVQGLRPANPAEAARIGPGSCTPMLIVVDGQMLQDISAAGGGFGGLFSLSSARLMDLNPEDVESVRILTPVEARFRYGSRGKYGAVIVETRSVPR